MNNICDCTTYCGDDSRIHKGQVTPCADYQRHQAHLARQLMLSNIDALLVQHESLLQGNPHCYFELAYTRSTGWMAFICDKPAGGTIGTPEFGLGRQIITSGQGDTPGEACAKAMVVLRAPA